MLRFFVHYPRFIASLVALAGLGSCADILGIPNTAQVGDSGVQAVDAGGPDAGPSCAVAPPGIVAWWDGEMVGVDIAGSFTSTTFRGAPTSVPGLVGNATQFGLDDLIEINPAPDPSTFTVEGWLFLTNQDPTWIGIYGRYRESSLCAYNNQLTFWEGTVGGSEAGNLARGATTLLNKWQHIAGTWDGTTFRTYVDGGLEAQDVMPGQVALPDIAEMGGLIDNGPFLEDPFAGMLDELTVYSRALGVEEIAAIAAAGAAGKCKPQSQ